MKLLTNEEIEIIEKHLDTIKIIVKNHSCSNISVEFRKELGEIGKAHNIQYCPTCQTGIYNLVARLYTLYVETKKTTKQCTKKKQPQNTKRNTRRKLMVEHNPKQ